VRGVFDSMTAGLTKVEHAAIEDLLSKLFPRLQGVFGNVHYGSDSYERWEREQRICTETYFDRYFRYAVPPRDIGDREFTTFVETAAAGASLDGSISWFCDGGGEVRFIAKLRRVEDIVPREDAHRIALALALGKADDLFPVEKLQDCFAGRLAFS
jgi:hypothetical protein